MSHAGHRLDRSHLAHEANQRALVSEKALTVLWRSKGRTRSQPVSYLTAGAVSGLTVAVMVWAAAVTSYLVFKDDILGGLMKRQADMQHVYEDRIRDLRGQVDRLMSRQMVDQSDIEQRVEQIARRQSMLETRQSVIGSLTESAGPARAGAIVPLPSLAPVAPNGGRPTPVGDTIQLTPPTPERQSQLESRIIKSVAVAPTPIVDSSKLATLNRLETGLERIETHQLAVLQALESAVERRSRRVKSVLADIGLDMRRMVANPHAGAPRGTGGPFIPIPAPSPQASPFEHQVHRTQTAMMEHQRVAALISAVPLVKPHHGELELSSGFGPRVDPFLRTWAMHAGIDFRGSTGEPVRATAAGRVTHAGSMGGYGLMVDIDHGNGLSTRYAHLSRIEVVEGDMVRLGQRVGRVGSTGRSTGPHLHYETRVHGDAVDPMRFVRAGLRLAQGGE